MNEEMDESVPDVNLLIQQVHSYAVCFIHLAGLQTCDSIILDSLPLRTHKPSIMDCLRLIRQWTSSWCSESSYQTSRLHELRTESFEHLKNLLDAILLMIVYNWSVNPIWLQFDQPNDAELSSNLLLTISITIQCLSNLLSESRDPIPVDLVKSLLGVLLTASRPLFLLTDQALVLLGDRHLNGQKRIMHYAIYLHYMIFLHLNRSNEMLDSNLWTSIMNKLMTSEHVLSSLIRYANSLDVANDSLRVDCQLLLSQLGCQSGSRLVWTCNNLCIEQSDDITQLDAITTATGVGLFAQQLDRYESDIADVQPNDNVDLPMSVKSCLMFWKMFTLRSAVVNAMTAEISWIQWMSNSLKEQSDTWFRDLYYIDLPETVSVDEPMRVLHQATVYPYAQLRGLCHILSEFVFANLSTDKCLSSHLQLGDLIDEKPNELNLSLSEADKLWRVLCDLLIMADLILRYLERLYCNCTFDERVLPSKHVADGAKECHIYQSRISKKIPFVPTRCPLSLGQAVEFKQDVVRSMAGILDHFPQFALSLAAHTFGATVGINAKLLQIVASTPPTPFEAILNATNRDAFNPFCVEWAILVIRLSVQSNSQHPDALQAAQMLANQLGNLQLMS